MLDTPLQTTRATGIPPTAVRSSGQISSEARVLSAAAGAVLMLLGLKRGGGGGLLTAAAGGALIARGVSGYCPATARLGGNNPVEKQVAQAFQWKSAATVSRSVTIRKPVEEIYRAWKDVANYPRFMDNIDSVTDLGTGRLRWAAKGPLGHNIEWETETIQDEPNASLSWKSVNGSDYNTSGTVTFKPAPGDRGTEVTLMLAYEPPAGQVGRAVAALFGVSPTHQARQNLISFKQLMETGEIATPVLRQEQQKASAS
jgi:uncharacterized membrane protein